jgi:two-component system, NarL family, sensor histidine kinase DegS
MEMASRGKRKNIPSPPATMRKPFLIEYEDIPDLTSDRIKTLVQDLRIHQVELEATVEDLKRSQMELQLSRDKYRELFDNIPVGCFTIDTGYAILDINAAAVKMFDASRRQLLKFKFTGLVAPTPLSQDSFYLFVRKVQKTGTAQECKIEMLRNNGTSFLAHLQAVPLINKTSDQGHHLCLTVTGINDSKLPETNLLESEEQFRRAVEQALAKARAELEIKVNQRARKLSQAHTRLKRYGRRITQAQEEERKRIAYQLHDDIGQYLSILKMEIEALLNSGKIQSPEIVQKLEFLRQDAGRTFNAVRRFSYELRPVVLEHLGLQAAIEQAVEDFNKIGDVAIQAEVDGEEPQLTEEIKLGFFRIAQEAINNARRHAKASRVSLDLVFQADRVRMAVSDNGIGFDLAKVASRSKEKGGLGLMSMHQRADLIGARLKIESKPGRGTTVRLEIPL